MKRHLVVDASVDSRLGGVAGLGVGFLEGAGLTAEAALVGQGDIQLAEALAVTRGLSELADLKRTSAGSVVITDNQPVYRAIVGIEPDLRTLSGTEVVDYARQLMAEFGFRVEWRPRKAVRPAHKMARMALEIFRAGMGERSTWACPMDVTELSPEILGGGVPAYPPRGES